MGVFQLSQLLQDPLSRCFEILSYKSINDIHIKRLSEFCEKRDRSDTFDEYGNLENLMEIQNTSVFATKERQRRLFTIDNMNIPKKGIILIKGKNGSGKTDSLFTGIEERKNNYCDRSFLRTGGYSRSNI